jgi:hypothetical protein
MNRIFAFGPAGTDPAPKQRKSKILSPFRMDRL